MKISIIVLIILVLISSICFGQDEDIEFSSTMLETIPKFENCLSVAPENDRDCFNSQLQKHILKNFNYPEEAEEKNITGKVYVHFSINTEGKVVINGLFGPENGESLIAESLRIIKKLPKFIPGKQRGKPVNVVYRIPILFNLELEKNERNNSNRIGFYDFESVHQIPQFSSCNDSLAIKSKECFKTNVEQHILKNIKFPKDLKTKDKKIEVKATFVINDSGVVTYATGVCSNNIEHVDKIKFIEEAKRILLSLPKFKPGINKYKEVSTVVSDFTINFSKN